MAADQLGAIFDWDGLGEILGRLGTAAEADGTPDVVVGILRGGMVPAVLLAHALAVRDVRGVDVTRTVGEGVDAAKTRQPVQRNLASLGDLTGMDVLVVDDVAGSGATVAMTADLVREAGAVNVRTAVCAVNEVNWAAAANLPARAVLTYVGELLEGWVVFPWER